MKEGELDVSEQTSICHDQFFKKDNKCKIWLSLSLHKTKDL